MPQFRSIDHHFGHAEDGRFRGYDGLADLMARFQEQVPGGRVIRSSGIDQFEGIPRYSWTSLTEAAQRYWWASTSLSRTPMVDFGGSSCFIALSRLSTSQN